ncbi:hypothetical protein [Paenibacillus wynnii]|uniref:Uncharacterized protein n=1 Tax=Paenibacillus wynnii TaxID=268407 RepID=A0A098M6P8_9BACL|nr:hypothetical protein [Paenibacillus wynnii]KGE18249.1 hypothetical protein PWYN_27360 [Paenibacillus wynnii]
MTKRIQAYFRTEDEAEGAKTSLISYNVKGLEVSPLTDPLDSGARGNRNILVPLVAYSNTSMSGGLAGVGGTTGSVAGNAAILPAIAAVDPTDDKGINLKDGEVRNDTEVTDADLDNLHYVMELKVPRENYLEVIETLRNKHAFVEVFE